MNQLYFNVCYGIFKNNIECYNNRTMDSELQTFKQEVQRAINKMALTVLCIILVIICCSIFVQENLIMQQTIAEQKNYIEFNSKIFDIQIHNNIQKIELFLNRTRQIFQLNISNYNNLCFQNIQFICETSASTFAFKYSPYYALSKIQYYNVLNMDNSIILLFNASSSQIVFMPFQNVKIISKLNNETLKKAIKSKLILGINDSSFNYLEIDQNIMICLNVSNVNQNKIHVCLLNKIEELMNTLSKLPFGVIINQTISYYSNGFRSKNIGSVIEQYNNYLYSNKLYIYPQFDSSIAGSCLKYSQQQILNKFMIQCQNTYINQRSPPILLQYNKFEIPTYFYSDIDFKQTTYKKSYIQFIIFAQDTFYQKILSKAILNDSIIQRLLQFCTACTYIWSIMLVINRYIVKNYILPKIFSFKLNSQSTDNISELSGLRIIEKKYDWVIKYINNSNDYKNLLNGLEIFDQVDLKAYILEQIIRHCKKNKRYKDGINFVQELIVIELNKIKANNENMNYPDINSIFELQLKKLKFLYKHIKNTQFNSNLQAKFSQIIKRFYQYRSNFDIEEVLEQKFQLYRLKIYSFINHIINFNKLQQLEYSNDQKISYWAKYISARQLFKKHPLFDYQSILKLYNSIVQIETTQKFKYKALNLMSQIFQKHPKFGQQALEIRHLAKYHNKQYKKVSFIVETLEGFNENIINKIIKQIYSNITETDMMELISINTSYPKQIIPEIQKKITEQELISIMKHQIIRPEGSKRTKPITEILLDSLKKVCKIESEYSKYIVIILCEFNSQEGRSERGSIKRSNIKQIDFSILNEYFHLMIIINKSSNRQFKKWNFIKKLKESKSFFQIDLKKNNIEEIKTDIKNFFS